MKKRTSSLPLLVIVAVVALVLGSFGTATAAGLNAHQVKKIAKKVVKKKAPTLSVAHATTADTATNATNLGGQPPSAYLTTTTVAQVTTGTFAGQKNWNFTVPAGTLLISFDAGINAGAGANTLCGFRTGATSPFFAWDGSVQGASYVASWMSASAIRTYAAPTNLSFFCNSSAASFTVDSNVGITVNVTKLDGTSSAGTLTPVKSSSDMAGR